MNMAKKSVLAAGLTLLGGAAAFGENARVYFNNWTNDCQLTQTGNYYSGTFQAHAGGSSDETFDTQATEGTVTQTATATLSWISYKFFKAAIEVDVPNNEDP